MNIAYWSAQGPDCPVWEDIYSSRGLSTSHLIFVGQTVCVLMSTGNMMGIFRNISEETSQWKTVWECRYYFSSLYASTSVDENWSNMQVVYQLHL